MKVLKPDAPERQHLPDRHSLAGACLSGSLEELAVVTLVWATTLFQALQHRRVAVAYELASQLDCDIVIGAHRPRGVDGLLDGCGDIAAHQSQQLTPAVVLD